MGDANAKLYCVETSAPVLARSWLAFTKDTVVTHPAWKKKGAKRRKQTEGTERGGQGEAGEGFLSLGP